MLTLKNFEDQALGWVSRKNFQTNTMELADGRVSIFVTIKNLENNSETRKFEIPCHIP